MAEYGDQHLRGEAEKGGGEGRRESHALAGVGAGAMCGVLHCR